MGKQTESQGTAPKGAGGGVDGLDEYRESVRAAGFQLNPYRLGLAAGRANALTPSKVPANPYTNARGRRLYADGVRHGVQQGRRDHAALAKAGGES